MGKTIFNTDGIYSNVLDAYTGEYVTYIGITIWQDGTPMDDSKCDGVFYKKSTDGTYLKRVSLRKINIKDFGAKGDGVTNDTAAFNRAQDAISTIYGIDKGATIYFPSGVYILNSIVIKPKIGIEGDGVGYTILKMADCNNNDLITLTLGSYLNNFRHFTLYGNKCKNTSGNGIVIEDGTVEGANFKCIHDKKINPATNTYKLTHIEDVVICRFPETGLSIGKFNYYTTVEDLFVFDCRIGFVNRSTDNFFTRIIVERCGKVGIDEGGANNKWVKIKTIFHGQGDYTGYKGGMVFNYGARNIVIGAEAQDNYGPGFIFSNTSDITMVGCLADGNGYDENNAGRSDGTSAGYTFINSSHNKLVGCRATNYKGNYQSYAYSEDNASFDNNVEEIIESGQRFTSKGIFSSIKNDLFYCKRPTSFTYEGIEFGIDQPIKTDTGVLVTEADTLVIPKTLIINETFSMILDFTYHSHEGGIPRFLRSSNNDFTLVYNSSAETPSIELNILLNGALSRIGIIEVTLMPETEYRLGVVFVKKDVNVYVTTLTVSNIKNSGDKALIRNSTSRSAYLEFNIVSLLINGLYSDGPYHMNMTVHRLLFMYDKVNIESLNIHNNLIVNNAVISLDFTKGRLDNGNITALTTTPLPEASAFYRGQTLAKNGPVGYNDELYTCIRNAGGGYQWVPLTFNEQEGVWSIDTTTGVTQFSGTYSKIGKQVAISTAMRMSQETVTVAVQYAPANTLFNNLANGGTIQITGGDTMAVITIPTSQLNITFGLNIGYKTA